MRKLAWCMALLGLAAGGGVEAQTPVVTQKVSFTADDGVPLRAFVSGYGSLAPRPLIVEFSPYAPTSFSDQFSAPAAFGHDFGPDYNYLEVNARGTGQSEGVWSAIGPRDQEDVAEVLAWACKQPWSNGHIGLYGFSASAIAIYNSMHLPLSCVDAASLMAGSDDLYRDLLYPGGIFNFLPATVVAVGVGGPLLESMPANQQNGETLLQMLQTGIGFLGLDADILAHTTEDSYWQVRTQTPGPNRFPVLIDTSFYDPEPRGPFQSFRYFQSIGVQTHFMTFGAHDGFPAGTQGPFPEFQRWYDNYLRGVANGVQSDPPVQLLLGNGSREALSAGDYTKVNASTWPVPGTVWQPLYLDPKVSFSALSLNDGSLSAAPPAKLSVQIYLDVPSLPTATDPQTTSTVAVTGEGPLTFNDLFDAMPLLTEMNAVTTVSLTYTTPPLSAAVDMAGPADLDIFVATALPVDDVYAVLADVAPNGIANAVGVGRLRSGFPNIILSRSLIDAQGQVVQPYGDYSALDPAVPGSTRELHVEFWPIGNHFAAGHRLRLYLVGTSAYMLPAIGLNLVSIGGGTASRLLLPVLPGSDVYKAMGAR
jgi:uncharacterized protein